MEVQAPVLNMCSRDFAAFTDTGVYPDDMADVDAYGFVGYLFSGVIQSFRCGFTVKFDVVLGFVAVKAAFFNPASFLDFGSSSFLTLFAICLLCFTISVNFKCSWLVLYL